MKNRRKSKKKIEQFLFALIILICLTIISYFKNDIININDSLANENEISSHNNTYISLEEIPEYTSDIYVTINNNIPYFEESEYTTESFEKYSELDKLGRCGVAYANICMETLPTYGEEREDISKVKPTGWKQKKYNGEYLYNRCHLIGYQLSAENANELNIITGTRYFNVSGMLPFENKVADYIDKNENNHVLYRVTPIYDGDNYLASGVEMEAYSVEDKGEGVCFNVYVYNVQPGVSIDYKTGESTENM